MKVVHKRTAIGFVLTFAASSLAQQLPASISGQGMAVIEKQPQVLRLHLDLSAQAKSLKEALTKLKERKEKALKQFAEWGAAKESIEAGAPKVTPSRGDQQKRMEMMVRARLQSRPAAEKPEQMLKVSCGVKAEWKVEGMDAEAILLRAHELQEQIKLADLAGAKADAAGTPEQQEEMEENEGMQWSNSNEQPAGEPVFLYISRISGEEMSKGMADAFAHAQDEARQLAGAAKVGLGKLQSLSHNSGPDYSQNVSYAGPYASMYYRYIQQAQAAQRAGSEEAIGGDPSKVSHRIMVMASFAIQQ